MVNVFAEAVALMPVIGSLESGAACDITGPLSIDSWSASDSCCWSASGTSWAGFCPPSERMKLPDLSVVRCELSEEALRLSSLVLFLGLIDSPGPNRDRSIDAWDLLSDVPARVCFRSVPQGVFFRLSLGGLALEMLFLPHCSARRSRVYFASAGTCVKLWLNVVLLGA